MKTPKTFPLEIRTIYNRKKGQYEVKLGYMLLARFARRYGGIVFCYCPQCLEERGDPYSHDLKTKSPARFARAVESLYPCSMKQWLRRLK